MSDLRTIRERTAREKVDESPLISISSGTCGQACGSLKIVDAFKDALKALGLKQKVTVKVTGCHGFCAAEPNVIIYPDKIFYVNLSPGDAEEIVKETVVNKRVIDRLVYSDKDENKYPRMDEIPFYKKQLRIVTGDNPRIDPTKIEDYVAIGGYKALENALSSMTSDEIIEVIKKSQLRGRGGAGFPTGFKWDFCRRAKGDVKYIICNADEGDPGAYMDRSLLEGNPHSVIEGMILGAYAIGATQGWIYVRDEYPLAVKHVGLAIEQAKGYGLLGENILGSGFNFDIAIIRGAGAFVCGEETALIQSIESSRGVPRQRPPFPVTKGLWGKPTVINNVETWANVPKILEKGADWFANIGTKTSKGTKIFSLVGKIKNTGLVEVPMGITLKEIVYDIGGGSQNGEKIKAVQTGGPSGGCIPTALFDLPVDYESLTGAGSIMGSGGMIVMDDRTCMVDVAKYFTNFLRDESCGKCVTCREGTQRMFEILSEITEGKGTEEDLATLGQLGQVVRDTSLCGLGQTAANPMFATLQYFNDEYIQHVQQKRCNAAVCREIVSSPCQHTCPIGQEAAVYIALLAKGKFEEALKIIKKDNPLSSVLARVCHHPCESKCRAGEGGDPIAIRDLKRFITDYGIENKLMLKAKPAITSDKGRVAIIGSGPAGLTCGFYLAQKGYGVTIFEKLPTIGGMLSVGIPAYRLPREVFKADIDYIKSSGIEILTNNAPGIEYPLEDLFEQGYKAIFIATGAHQSLQLNTLGEDAEGVFPGMEVLTALNLGKEVKIGKKVGVIGGGNSAVDAARTILRTGLPKSVTIFYRRTIAEMPAYEEEVSAALEEGVKIQFLTAPKRIVTDDGKLFGCEFIKMKLGMWDETGRRTPLPLENSEFIEELDTLVIAIGERPNISFLENETGFVFSNRGTLVVDAETLATNRKGIFAGGDLVTGPNTVVEACASGKIAAESIDMYLCGKEPKREYRLTRPSVYIEPLALSDSEIERLSSAKRPAMTRLFPRERVANFKEVEEGLSEEQAVNEAKRCLRCDLETEDAQRSLKEGR